MRRCPVVNGKMVPRGLGDVASKVGHPPGDNYPETDWSRGEAALEGHQLLFERLLGVNERWSISGSSDLRGDQGVVKWWNDELPTSEGRDMSELHQVLLGVPRCHHVFKRLRRRQARGYRAQAIDDFVHA